MSFRTLVAPAALLVAAACTDSGSDPTTPLMPHLVAEAGDGQESVPGTELALPLLVRVVQGSTGVQGIMVTWEVKSGKGDFLSPARVMTDANGEAQVRFRPRADRNRITATIDEAGPAAEFRTVPRPMAIYTQITSPNACGDYCQEYTFYPDSTFSLRYGAGGWYPGTFTPRDSILSLRFSGSGSWAATGTIRGDSILVHYNDWMMFSDFEDAVLVVRQADPALPWLLHLEITAGNGQTGEAGDVLRDLIQARVVGRSGAGVRGVRVAWKVVSGSGEILYPDGLVSTSENRGEAHAMIAPTGLGALEISATLADGFAPPVVFHATASCWAQLSLLQLWRVGYASEDGFYLGQWTPPFRVRLGTTVQIHNGNMTGNGAARFRSPAVPEGGTPFDSGLLEQGAVFSFAPDREGSWLITDDVSGLAVQLDVSGILGEPRCPVP